jgi:hypothetical protein
LQRIADEGIRQAGDFSRRVHGQMTMAVQLIVDSDPERLYATAGRDMFPSGGAGLIMALSMAKRLQQMRRPELATDLSAPHDPAPETSGPSL